MEHGTIRVGIGFDSHAMERGRRCVLGGVPIEDSPVGPAGHSDGDCVLHAVTDALLGAAGMEDIGTHFPDDSPRWKDADSAEILSQVTKKVKDSGYVPVNVDVTVILEEPRLSGHKEAMKRRIAEIMGMNAEDVGVKAKTPEGLQGCENTVVSLAVVAVKKAG